MGQAGQPPMNVHQVLLMAFFLLCLPRRLSALLAALMYIPVAQLASAGDNGPHARMFDHMPCALMTVAIANLLPTASTLAASPWSASFEERFWAWQERARQSVASPPEGRVKKAIFFDVSELQLQYGQLLLHLIQLHPTREALVEALYGRSMARFGRVLCASNMMDFLNEAPAAEPEIQTRERLPEQLQDWTAVDQRYLWV
eukprot:g29319.t1